MDYQSFFRERYAQEDPWHFGSCPFEKIRQDAMIEFALSMRPQDTLDLGCGEGHFLGRLLSKAPGIKATGVEMDTNAISRSRSRLARFEARLVQADLLDFVNSPVEESFDAIFCGDVLYYLTPEVVAGQVVPGVVQRLRPGGGLVVSYADVNDHQWTVEVFRDRFRQIGRASCRERVYI